MIQTVIKYFLLIYLIFYEHCQTQQRSYFFVPHIIHIDSIPIQRNSGQVFYNVGVINIIIYN